MISRLIKQNARNWYLFPRVPRCGWEALLSIQSNAMSEKFFNLLYTRFSPYCKGEFLDFRLLQLSWSVLHGNNRFHVSNIKYFPFWITIVQDVSCSHMNPGYQHFIMRVPFSTKALPVCSLSPCSLARDQVPSSMKPNLCLRPRDRNSFQILDWGLSCEKASSHFTILPLLSEAYPEPSNRAFFCQAAHLYEHAVICLEVVVTSRGQQL